MTIQFGSIANNDVDRDEITEIFEPTCNYCGEVVEPDDPCFKETGQCFNCNDAERERFELEQRFE